ncbi:MAG: hypothetical protein AAF591_06975 [Verrucomicrobiota bacterium]
MRQFILILITTLLGDNPLEAEQMVFQARASELNPNAKEYPAIDFTFGTLEKPLDLQHATVDLDVNPRGQLVIWLMAYKPELFERLNQYGLHAIQPHYANKWFSILCQPEPNDGLARGKVRLEAATGDDISPELDLAKPDGMMERARQFLIWLDQENPEANWAQFLTDDQSAIHWDKVIIAGSSHGSTTAARFAKHQEVARVVMLCGPRDQDQDWQALRSKTPAHRFFGFSHVLDRGWADDHYCRSWELLGLHDFGPVINIDDSKPPFQNTRRLTSNADVNDDAKKAHSAVTPGKASPKNDNDEFIYEDVWEYLFTHPVDEIGIAVPEDASCLKIHPPR